MCSTENNLPKAKQTAPRRSAKNTLWKISLVSSNFLVIPFAFPLFWLAPLMNSPLIPMRAMELCCTRMTASHVERFLATLCLHWFPLWGVSCVWESSSWQVECSHCWIQKTPRKILPCSFSQTFWRNLGLNDTCTCGSDLQLCDKNTTLPGIVQKERAIFGTFLVRLSMCF